MVAFPRVAIVLLYFFSTFFERARLGILILVLGFIFLPLTTVVYAWIINTGNAIQGIYLVAIVIAVLADIGLLGGGWRSRRD